MGGWRHQICTICARYKTTSTISIRGCYGRTLPSRTGTLGRCGRIARPRDTRTRGESGHYTDGRCAQGRHKCTERTSGTDGRLGRTARTDATDGCHGGRVDGAASKRHGRTARTDATDGCHGRLSKLHVYFHQDRFERTSGTGARHGRTPLWTDAQVAAATKIVVNRTKASKTYKTCTTS